MNFGGPRDFYFDGCFPKVPVHRKHGSSAAVDYVCCVSLVIEKQRDELVTGADLRDHGGAGEGGGGGDQSAAGGRRCCSSSGDPEEERGDPGTEEPPAAHRDQTPESHRRQMLHRCTGAAHGHQ